MVNFFCGNQAVLRTSWTDHNPGRRFLCCAQIVNVSFNVSLSILIVQHFWLSDVTNTCL